MEPLPTVKTAFSLVSREESNQKHGFSSNSSNSNKVQSSAFVSKFSDQKKCKGKIKFLNAKIMS